MVLCKVGEFYLSLFLPRQESRFPHYFDSVVPRNQNCYATFSLGKKKRVREATKIYIDVAPKFRILKSNINSSSQHADSQIFNYINSKIGVIPTRKS